MGGDGDGAMMLTALSFFISIAINMYKSFVLTFSVVRSIFPTSVICFFIHCTYSPSDQNGV